MKCIWVKYNEDLGGMSGLRCGQGYSVRDGRQKEMCVSVILREKIWTGDGQLGGIFSMH